MVSNNEFARRIGVHPTMASRLRSGKRSPSTTVVSACAREFGLTDQQVAEWLQAIDNGSPASGIWMTANVFNLPSDAPTPAPTA